MRPTERRPVAYSPTYAVATTATAIATSDMASPKANATSGPGLSPTTLIGRRGTARSIDQPIVPPPWMCISWMGSVSARESAAAGRRIASARRRGSRRQSRMPTKTVATTTQRDQQEERAVDAQERGDEFAGGCVIDEGIAVQRLVAIGRKPR